MDLQWKSLKNSEIKECKKLVKLKRLRAEAMLALFQI